MDCLIKSQFSTKTNLKIPLFFKTQKRHASCYLIMLLCSISESTDYTVGVLHNIAPANNFL